jgi:non-specific serine/threonine protein kinase
MELLSRELDNVRSALRYALDVGDPDLGLRIAGSIWRFWEISGHLAEGRQWLENLLENQEASDSVRAKGLTGLAGLAYWQADHDVAWDRYREALGLYQAIGDRFNEADTLFSMSMTASWDGKLDIGERLAEDARSLFEDLGAKEEIGKIQMAQAFVLTQKREFAVARRLWEASLAMSRELGYQNLAITQSIGLAVCEFHDGENRKALGIALEALEEAADAQNVQLAVWMLDFFAAFAASTAPEAAVRLSGAVNSLRRVLGGGMRIEPLGIEDGLVVAARVLDPETLDQALAEGRAMTLDQAVAYAQELKKTSEVAF